MKPNEIAEMSDKEITDLLQDYVSEHEDKFAESYLFSIIKIVRSWLAHNGKDRKIKIEGAEQSPTLKNERIPTQDELI
ncbi:MAG: site-specific integrase, partial [Thermoplasmatales archaeon]